MTLSVSVSALTALLLLLLFTFLPSLRRLPLDTNLNIYMHFNIIPAHSELHLNIDPWSSTAHRTSTTAFANTSSAFKSMEWKRDLEPRTEQAFPYSFKVSGNARPGSTGSLFVDLHTHERIFVKSVWKGFFAFQNDTFPRLDITGIVDVGSSASCANRLLKEGGLQLEDVKGKSYQLMRLIWGVPASRVSFFK